MHDIRLIRDNPDAFDAAMARRGLSGVSGELLSLDETRRAAILAAETAQAEANKAAKEVGAAKGRGDEAEFERLRALVGEKKSEIARLNDEAKALDAKLTEILMGLPNTIYDDVPAGEDEDDNVEINRWGTPREMDFKPVEHYDLPAVQSGLDFETAAKLSGSRFMVLSGAVARTHRALAQFMLDVHTEENGLTETWTPVLVKEEMMYGTGQLPKFGEDSYKTEDGWWLVPTAEVSLTNIVNGETVSEGYLPRRYVAHTQCFRSEAGSAGRDTAGMLRQHQFEKVEMVSVTKPEESEAEHARMTRCAEDILERLELPYRTVNLCTGDIGFGAKRTHDIEVWLPGQNTYREISSVSTCGDFQARRMNARYKPAEGGKPQFVHTLNGSGLAVGRALIAVLENGQQADGSVDLPAALHPYLRGKTRITAEGELV
ncbi:serine--tRNA ligase [Aliiroseovarius crassostreae]|uniref:serine--tRNA ligase n=1 Tax=Aliiroseovarius crassostreae TaxID=154981 RepID=UPI0021AE92DD|nr:serine--tRNA ligase [Aliiroseovarius crassostreae]UWP91297.1 serine--tRNA ligase [Aliiroseovarius crassostreae]UWP97607.1 serine--tRNA ligase [Aliiroseovarius crassostreae]UWQ07063.1 serine--tRNA ligase [Aliiroseovarius crassostreae]UWQ10172.1 serine--tRNA ligase [Aliiroseovarius crassostreae]